MLKRLVFFLVSLVVSVTISMVVTWFAYLRPLRDRWGVVPDETERALPGDDLVPGATLVETRGITVNASPRTGSSPSSRTCRSATSCQRGRAAVSGSRTWTQASR